MTEITDNTSSRETGSDIAIGRGLILFDGDCGICRTSAGLTERYLRARGFRFLPLQTPGVPELTGASREALLEELHIVTPARQTLRGLDAILHLLGANPIFRPLAGIARWPVMNRLLRLAYRGVARRRYRVSAFCGLERGRSAPTVLRWTPAAALVVSGILAGAWLSSWVWMWALALSIYFACKWITWWPARRLSPSAARSTAYLLFWSGMDAAAFLTASPPDRPLRREWIRSIATTIVGVLFLWFIARPLAPRSILLAGWAGMIGLAMTVHFGALDLLSLSWRRAGVDAEPVMRRPLAATSLADFWGRRWNTAFHQLVHDLVFTPLIHRRAKVLVATAAVFLVSGVLHDLVISLPACAGFGLPTLYFMLQFAGLSLERLSPVRRMIRKPLLGWLWTLSFTLAPAPLLFHPAFVRTVFVPFLHAIGGLP